MLCLALLLPLQLPVAGLASRYDYVGDKYAGPRRYACERRLVARWGRRGWRLALQTGVASRTLPCGTRVRLCRLGGRCVTAVVVDRGPWGALDERGRWHLRFKLRKGERWRGLLDLRWPVADRVDVQGVEPALVLALPPR